MKFSLGYMFQSLFGFSFWPLWARNSLVVTRMSGALQQGFCWGFNLLCGWAGTAPFWVTEFENTVRVFAGVCFICV
jgi:hypothetical protein